MKGTSSTTASKTVTTRRSLSLYVCLPVIEGIPLHSTSEHMSCFSGWWWGGARLNAGEICDAGAAADLVVLVLHIQVKGSGFRRWGSGFGVWGSGVCPSLSGLWFRV